MTEAATADAVVIGGGVIGSAIARELARAGLHVVVLERDQPGFNASWAAAGMLSPQAEADRADAFLSLLLHSRRLYPQLAAELGAETGTEVGYRAEGTLLVALTPQDEAELRERYAWQRDADLPVEWLTPADARRLEPAVNPGLRAALRFPDDHQVDNRLLSAALWESATRAGATMRRGVSVARVLVSGDQVRGVELASGERIAAKWVIVAAGAASRQLEGLPTPPPVRPVHGQLVALKPSAPIIRHVMDSPRIYLVPRRDGRVIVGATVEEVGFSAAVTAGGVHALLTAALELVPGLASAPLVESWSGHRPGTPDGLPILGADPAAAGLVYATGHYRNGILLVPITALLVADLILGREPHHDLAPFRPGRFAER